MKLENIKRGQYLYYTERDYGDNYADSLVNIREISGVLMAHPICVNWKGAYINETSKNWGEDLPVASFYNESYWYPTNYMGGDPSEWMTLNYPLENN